jgi:hypothetical protein
MHKRLMIFLLLGIGTKAHSQLQESTFKLEYLLSPAGSNNTGMSKTGLKNTSVFNVRKLKVENTASVDSYQFTYPVNFNLDAEELGGIYNFSEKVDLGYPLSEKWELHADFGVALVSTLGSKITEQDFVYTGGSYLKRGLGNGKASHITLGVGYYTFFGKPEIYPVFSYYREISGNFSVEFGFPSTVLNYNFNEKAGLKATLDFNGIYANLSNPVNADWENTAQKAELYKTSLGLDYNYELDESWSFNLGAGYLLNNEYNLLNRKNNNIFSVNTASQPFFTTGIKFNLKTKP